MGKDETVFEGRNLDDAVRKGLDALGLSRAEVVITVIDEGSSGFLGLGARPYRVRVVRRPGGPPPVESDHREDRGDRRARGRGGRGGQGERRGGGPGRRDDRRREGPREAIAGRDARPRRGGQGRDQRPGREGREGGREHRERVEGAQRAPRADAGPRPEQPARVEAPPRAPSPLPRADEGGAGFEGARRRRRRGGRGRRGGEPPREARLDPTAPVIQPVAEVFEEEVAPMAAANGSGMTPAELEQQATQITRELFTAMGYEAEVSARAEMDRVDVRAIVPSGEEELTGHKGEVRQALQHILNRMINRGGGSAYHLQLEVNDFWERREAELRDLARQLAEEALANRSETVTEYLNAQERRIVHVTLKEDERVRTYALGTGLIKRVAVAPADFPERSESD
jgi:spoIIIJ-associated protein